MDGLRRLVALITKIQISLRCSSTKNTHSNKSRTINRPIFGGHITKTRRVHQGAFFCTEFPFRTPEACFLHRVPLKTRRVHQKAFSCTECQTPERRSPSQAPNRAEVSPERRCLTGPNSQENHPKKFAIPPQSYSVPLGKAGQGENPVYYA